MKRVVPIFLLLAVVGLAAFVVFKKVVIHQPRAAELVPAETILFVQIPNTTTSAQRFTKTALWEIFQEPEIQRLLDQPKKSGALKNEWTELGERVLRILPREGFAAITSIDGTVPTFVAGFAYTGRQKDAEAVMAEARAELRKVWPAGKADLTTYGKREIETFTDKNLTMAEVFADGWYFIANELELLHATLDRLDGKGDGAQSSLAQSDVYQQVTAPLPAEPDGLIVAQLGTVIERLTALMIAAGQKTDPKELEELKKTQAFAAATKFDGAQCRDTIFVLRPGSTAEPALARNGLALSSSATLLYYAMALPLKVELSEQSVPMLALIPGWDLLHSALTGKQLTLADLPKAFGPELGSLLEWPQGADTPSFLVAIDVRDGEKAAAFLEVFTGGKLGGVAWAKQTQDGTTLFSAPPDNLTLLAPTIALTDKFAVFGLSAETVAKGLAQLKDGAVRLDSAPAYTAAMKTVTAPTAGFAYLDLPVLFERGYAVLKPLLAMSLAFNPEAGQHFDAGKLPPAATITRHLGPIVYSQANSERGTLIESTGPLTFNQVLIGGAGGAIAAALPAMQAALSSGTLLDPNQLLKGLGSPGQPSLVPPPIEVTPEPAPPATSAEPSETPAVEIP